MKDAYAEFQKLRQNWQQARSARPSEVDFSSFGFKSGNAEDFDALFEEWEQALGTAASKTKSVGADDRALEAVIIHFIIQLNNNVAATTNNGFQWLIQSGGFVQRVSDLNVALTPVLDRRFRVRKALMEAVAKDALNNDITKVEAAAPLADALVKQQNTICQQATDVEGALAQSIASEKQAATSKEEAQKHLDAIKQAAQEAATRKADYDKTVVEANEALDEARDVLDTIKRDREMADKQVVESNSQLEIANKKIMKAIADLNRQGLAGAFDNSAKRLGRERFLWMATFVLAILYLISVVLLNSNFGASFLQAIVKVSITNPTATLPLWEQALHVLPLAAPGIWLGWFAAKNASLTARIQQDYTYKVATAQSFEAYKREVMASDDKALEKQLLETTIRNFGDNPIRIYDGTSVEGHPLEALKSVLDDKSFGRLLELLKAIKPSIGG